MTPSTLPHHLESSNYPGSGTLNPPPPTPSGDKLPAAVYVAWVQRCFPAVAGDGAGALRESSALSTNVREFHTNVGELKHRFVCLKNADIVFVSETFLDTYVPTS